MIEIEEETTTTPPLLPIPLIHHIFDTYTCSDYKLLIHKEGSTDKDGRKKLSIELIMMYKMEDYLRMYYYLVNSRVSYVLKLAEEDM